MAILRNDKTVQSVLEAEDIPAEQLPQKWFSASVVHLSSASRGDLVVVGNAPISGGNTALFWVFRRTTNGYKLVLAIPTHDLILRKKYWKGYREIEALGIAAGEVWTVSYRCNGDQYLRYKTTSKKID